MRIEYLAAIGIAAFVAGTGLAAHSVGSLPPEKQSTPVTAQLATRLAESVDPFCIGPVANGRRNSKTHWRRCLSRWGHRARSAERSARRIHGERLRDDT
jgi:hypothetical protein